MSLQLLIVAIGSGVGGALRYSVSLIGQKYPSFFPYWTLAVNVLGGLCIGYLAAWFGDESGYNRLLLITGFCGGFTTFSAFSLETLELFRQGRIGWGMLNIILNVVCALGACWIGYRIGK